VNKDGKCHVEPIHKEPSEDEQSVITSTRLAIWGMGCPNCANRVRNNLLSVRGVVGADVNHFKGLATVLFNPNLTSTEQLIRAVVLAGEDGRHEYRAQPVQ
jgi:copper chaperone CopZ